MHRREHGLVSRHAAPRHAIRWLPARKRVDEGPLVEHLYLLHPRARMACQNVCPTATGRPQGNAMIDHDNLEEFRDAQRYDLEDEGYFDDCPLTEQWAQSSGGPLLDL